MIIVERWSELDKLKDIPLIKYFKKLFKESDCSDNDDIVDCWGGALFLCENSNDLKEISTSLDSGKRWYNITETSDSFDDAKYILDGSYALLLMCWNNDGGPLYIIPKTIADTCANVAESIALTKTAWS